MNKPSPIARDRNSSIPRKSTLAVQGGAAQDTEIPGPPKVPLQRATEFVWQYPNHEEVLLRLSSELVNPGSLATDRKALALSGKHLDYRQYTSIIDNPSGRFGVRCSMSEMGRWAVAIGPTLMCKPTGDRRTVLAHLGKVDGGTVSHRIVPRKRPRSDLSLPPRHFFGTFSAALTYSSPWIPCCRIFGMRSGS